MMSQVEKAMSLCGRQTPCILQGNTSTSKTSAFSKSWWLPALEWVSLGLLLSFLSSPPSLLSWQADLNLLVHSSHCSIHLLCLPGRWVLSPHRVAGRPDGLLGDIQLLVWLPQRSLAGGRTSPQQTQLDSPPKPL